MRSKVFHAYEVYELPNEFFYILREQLQIKAMSLFGFFYELNLHESGHANSQLIKNFAKIKNKWLLWLVNIIESSKVWEWSIGENQPRPIELLSPIAGNESENGVSGWKIIYNK